MPDVVTVDEIRDLIRKEKITPQQLFDESVLKGLRDEARAAGYAEAMLKVEADRAKAEDKGPDRYLNPRTNPMIKPNPET